MASVNDIDALKAEIAELKNVLKIKEDLLRQLTQVCSQNNNNYYILIDNQTFCIKSIFSE